ncbi:MAG TPA: phospholipase D-like domain-containing protein [Puia sp.]|nr:phospholipase D-like domain-containing protein [Puia sp.]
MSIVNTLKGFTVTAYQGDAKTLLAFDLSKSKAAGLAGFSIQVQPHGKPAYYLLNKLLLPPGPKHAVLTGEPADSTANAPIQKYRWLHVPGSFHQGENVFYGAYTYTITPRYFKKGILQPLDPSLSNSIDIQVGPFVNGQLELAFTRGFVQSQGFVHHFGPNAPFQPKGDAKTLLFDTTQVAGANAAGQQYTFLQEYDWSGYTARERIFGVLNEIVADATLSVDVFAYDLNEPDIIKIFLKLAGEGRIRLILDNADLHHSTTIPKPEDQVETLFNQAAKAPAAILRGNFGRYAHDKVFVVYKDKVALKVLTGSTNFSVTGMYVNANHVLIFNDTSVADLYAKVFQEAWNDKVTQSFSTSSFAQAPFPLNKKGLPKMSITFSPHPPAIAASNLQAIADRVTAEASSVLFAVMSVSTGGGPVLPALTNVHSNQKVFSYGISDSPGAGISLYKPGNKTGVLVTGKPGSVNLPPPFDQEETVGIGHEIHHKFIVCGFNKPDAVVWCGSSNLALGGEEENGDNLIRIDDAAIATVFAIEAVSLVDHFDFRDSLAKGKAAAEAAAAKASKSKAKVSAKGPAAKANAAGKPAPAPTPGLSDNPPQPTLYLHADDSWVGRYYDSKDLYCSDRLLFSNKQ